MPKEAIHHRRGEGAPKKLTGALETYVAAKKVKLCYLEPTEIHKLDLDAPEEAEMEMSVANDFDVGRGG